MDLIVIGGSAGALQVIYRLLPRLQLPLPVLVVMHINRQTQSTLEQSLSHMGRYARFACDKDKLAPGRVLLAPAGYHVLVNPDLTVSMGDGGRVNFAKPSIDVTFSSAAMTLGARVLGVLLSGANRDGAEGLKKLQDEGAKTLVQTPESAEFAMMPHAALDIMVPSRLVAPPEMAESIADLVQV